MGYVSDAQRRAVHASKADGGAGHPDRKKSPKKMLGTKTIGEKASALKKISAACKAAAKRKFKVWPSAYASGWGVRCTRAGGPSKFGGGKKKK
jgi:hypothetical protein